MKLRFSLFLLVALFLAPAVAGAQSGASLTATPSSGAAPLSVSFVGNPNVGCDGGNFMLRYGDGQNDEVPLPADLCSARVNKTHVYSTPGSYTATLSRVDRFVCPPGEGVCVALESSETVLASRTITVSSPTSGGGSTPRPQCQMQASAGAVHTGQTVNLSWRSINASEATLTTVGPIPLNGTQGVIPLGPSTTYTARFLGAGGSAVCSITISVVAGTASFGGGNAPVTAVSDNGFPATGQSSTGSNIPLSQSTGAGITACGNTEGLTPGTQAYYLAATSCQACDLAKLGQRIINFLLGLSIPLAAAMFAWAGLLLFTSQGSEERVSRAKKIFKNVLIGFLIVLGAWLVVQTALKTLLKDSYYKNWNEIQCVGPTERNRTASLGDLINSLPILNRLDTTVRTGNVGSLSVSCPAGYRQEGSLCNNPTTGDVVNVNVNQTNAASSYSCQSYGTEVRQGPGGRCLDEWDNDVGAAVPVAPVAPAVARGDCTADNIQSVAAQGDDGIELTQSEAQVLSCLTTPESNCNNAAYPRYATPAGGCTRGVNCSSAMGVFQIVRGYSDDHHSLNYASCTNAAIAAGYTDVVSAGGNLNCAPAFRGGVSNGSRLAQACDAAAQNFTCNTQAAAGLVAERYERNPNISGRQLFADWTADARSSRQISCIDQYYRP